MEGRRSARSVAGASGDTGSPPAVAGASGSPPAVAGASGSPPAVAGASGSPPAVAGASGSPPPAVAGGGGSGSTTTSENVSTTSLGLVESEAEVPRDNDPELWSTASLASVSMLSASLPPAVGDSEEIGSPPPTQNIRDENTNVNSSLTDNEAELVVSSASLALVSMPSASLPSAAGDSEDRGSPPPKQNGVTDSDTVRMPSISVPSTAPTCSVSLPSMVGHIEDTVSPAQNRISGPPSPVSLFRGEAVLVSPTSSTTSSSEDTGGGHEHRS